ncbi:MULTISPECIES: hypothetical protein [Metabacillus]|jgi:hypothetical protein|uniref:Uncharacterized protein n=2 Tax=Metabacillus TaxID=2675233 RepID=A0A179T8M9_9BACI|nr:MULTISPECIES: hypothetical protein [Metabacillus]OAS89489.1 hypothetical protein A6K24_02760 [Metabacillus litoralis]QNF29010.1 hypothetical protein HUW50_16895 [Metabacillus sp. KUDC1714]
MWETRGNRILEISIIVILGAIVSILNTLWLRESLIEQIKIIAKDNENNIIKQSNVTDIATKLRQQT